MSVEQKFVVFILCFVVCKPVFTQVELPSEDGSPLRIALLGCHKQFEPAPALYRYLEVNPDLCLWIGDNIYADTPDDIHYIDSCYQALAAKPAFRQIKSRYPYMATWDDHDFGLNNAGKEYPLKELSKERFIDFWNLEDQIPTDQDGIYYRQLFQYQEKQIQIIMLDVRYNRDEPGINGDPLGENQWNWLADVLEDSADLSILVSGIQIFLPSESGSETWDNFPDARQRLLDLIRIKRVENLVFIAGDQHYGEVSRINGALDYDAIELQFAGINQIEKPEFNPYRVSNVIESTHSYAYLDIHFDQTKYDVPHLDFQIFDALSNQKELFYRINLAELTLKTNRLIDTAFVGTHTVSLNHPYSNLNLYYTLDGRNPTTQSMKYTKPFQIHERASLKYAFFTKEGIRRTQIYEQAFIRLDPVPAQKPTNLKPGLAYGYYEGNFSDIPAFSTLKPFKEGIAQNFQIETVANRPDHYAIRYEGWIEITEEDLYTFFSYSDDGSKVYLHDQLVVDNGGSHSARKRSGQIPLAKGMHPIVIEYFEDYDGQTLQLSYKSNTGVELPLPFERFYHEGKK